MKNIISLVIRHVPRKYLQLVGHFAARVLAIFYVGSNVQCPICNKFYAKFLPYGRKARENALCPHCLSLERHRLIWIYLKEKTSLFRERQKLLHIAPEYCFINRFDSMEHLDYVTADLESPLAKIKMDVHDMPFDDDSFDCALCNHVLEHVADDRLAITELLRVLKPGGWAIVQVPFFPPVPYHTFEDPEIKSSSERFKHYGQSDHVRRYGRDYKQRLEGCGFIVAEDQYAKTLNASLRDKFALSDETIFFCRKAPA